MNFWLEVILSAYLLDVLIGDPQTRWHPVQIIGRLIARFEILLNRPNVNKKFFGLLFVILVVGITIVCVWGILKLSSLISPIAYFISCTLLTYFALAVKSLNVEANKVYAALKSRDIAQSKRHLAMIVGRDTENLDEPEVIRATVETVAESTMDGIVAPIFYAFLGGPILVWAYKAINTLDSMAGHKNERFIDFGMASAKIDAFLNLIPSKITSFLIYAAGLYNLKIILRPQWLLRYVFKGVEYNSESTEASMACVLGVQLGGINFYNSLPVKKALIGDGLYPLEIRHIRESIKISYISSFLAILFGSVLILILKRR